MNSHTAQEADIENKMIMHTTDPKLQSKDCRSIGQRLFNALI